jgi:hypothetical protein
LDKKLGEDQENKKKKKGKKKGGSSKEENWETGRVKEVIDWMSLSKEVRKKKMEEWITKAVKEYEEERDLKYSDEEWAGFLQYEPEWVRSDFLANLFPTREFVFANRELIRDLHLFAGRNYNCGRQ